MGWVRLKKAVAHCGQKEGLAHPRVEWGGRGAVTHAVGFHVGKVAEELLWNNLSCRQAQL